MGWLSQKCFEKCNEENFWYKWFLFFQLLIRYFYDNEYKNESKS